MSEQINNTNAAFMEVTSKKMEVQDKKIVAVEEKIKNIPDNTELIQQLITRVDGLWEDAKASHFPADKVNDFSSRLDSGINLLKQPVQNKVLHHHHVPKLIWVTAGLFIILALVCSGWYMTGNKLNTYIANDTKYRYLKLDTTRSFQIYLDGLDSLYNANTDMRERVLRSEEQNRENFERWQKAEQLKAEAKDLEKNLKTEEAPLKLQKKKPVKNQFQ